MEALVEGMNGTYEYVTVTGPIGKSSESKIWHSARSNSGDGNGGGIRHYTGRRTIKSVESDIHRSRRNDPGCSTKGMPRNLSLELAAVRRQRAVSECYLHWAMILWMKTETDCHRIFDSLEKVVQIKNNRVPEVLKDCHFQIACDVTNSLCGSQGCVYVFGSQKWCEGRREREHG